MAKQHKWSFVATSRAVGHENSTSGIVVAICPECGEVRQHFIAKVTKSQMDLTGECEPPKAS